MPFGGHLPEGLTGLEASDSGALILDHFTSIEVCDSAVGSATPCAAAAEQLRRNHTWITDIPFFRLGGTNISDSAYEAVRRQALSYGGPVGLWTFGSSGSFFVQTVPGSCPAQPTADRFPRARIGLHISVSTRQTAGRRVVKV